MKIGPLRTHPRPGFIFFSFFQYNLLLYRHIDRFFSFLLNSSTPNHGVGYFLSLLKRKRGNSSLIKFM